MERARCPQCDRESRTVDGRCVACGAVKDRSALPPPRPRVSYGDGAFGRVQNLFVWSVMVGLGLVVLLFALLTGAAGVAIFGALLYVLVIVFAGVRGWI